jgi:hypothetical protein
MVDFSILISMPYLKQWNKNFSVFSQIFPPQKAALFLSWNALPLFIHFFPMILVSLIVTRYHRKNWRKFLSVLYVGWHPGSRVFLKSETLWLCLEQALILGNPVLLGCNPTQKAIQSNLSCLWKEAPMWRHWTRANQLTMLDGWCVDRKHFFIEFLSGTNHPRTPTYLIVTYSLTYLLRYVIIIYIP